jgi:hypothetical protein
VHGENADAWYVALNERMRELFPATYSDDAAPAMTA